MAEKIVGVIWGIPLETENEKVFINTDKLQLSKGDCSQTFQLNQDGTCERTENLFSLAYYEGTWKYENDVLTLIGTSGNNVQFKFKSISEDKLEAE